MIPLNSRQARLREDPVPLATSWLMSICMESKGKQDLWTRRKPEVLEALRERAIVQSVESSNRIEGVTVEALRLRPVVLGRAKPKDRSEEELAGYRRALDWVFERKRPVPVTPAVIQKLHAMAQRGSTSDAGQWKARNNEIIEILPTGEPRLRFVAATAAQTPGLIARLCESYQDLCRRELLPPLLAVATFIFDFLCIHPFRDGNGRVSRLLTTLLLQSHDFQVARYISLERLVEEAKADYYRVLGECSRGWHEGKNEILPWWNYFLGIVRDGYREFEKQVNEISARPAKTDMVRRAVLDQPADFTLAELCAELPGLSPQLIKKVLADLKGEGEVSLAGRGRGAVWRLQRQTKMVR